MKIVVDLYDHRSYIGFINRDEASRLTKENMMSKYEARIKKQADSFYALIVRVDRDGEENVIHGYKGRFFKTMKAAQKSTSNYIAKI